MRQALTPVLALALAMGTLPFAAAASPAAAPAPAPAPVSAPAASAPAATPAVPRLTHKVVRSPDRRRDWELAYSLVDRKLTLRCVKSMTGRCGVRLVDAPRAEASEADLHVEWLGVAAGSTVERTLKGQAYGLCFRPDVGDDKACEPLSALKAL